MAVFLGSPAASPALPASAALAAPFQSQALDPALAASVPLPVAAFDPGIYAALTPAPTRKKQNNVATTNDDAAIKVYWGRLAFASVFLLVLLFGGFTAALLKLNDWSTVLLHSFELLLGIFIGLLGGDIAAKKTG
jgi:hypothetical protein